MVQGPCLGGIFGRTSGTAAGFSYSAANKDAAISWSENTLYDYLLNPKKYIPGALIPLFMSSQCSVKSIPKQLIVYEWEHGYDVISKHVLVSSCPLVQARRWFSLV